MNDNTKICTCDTMNLEAITHLWNYRPRKFRSDAFLFWSRGPDSYRKNDRKRAVVWPWLVLQLSTVLALTQLGIGQSDWRRAGIRSTNLHIVVESLTHSLTYRLGLNVLHLNAMKQSMIGIYDDPARGPSIVEGWAWISNFIPHLTTDIITYPCWD